MKFINYLYTLDNGNICLYPNYDQKLVGKREVIINCILGELQNFLEMYGKTNKFVILLDLTKVNVVENHDFILYRRLKVAVETNYPDKLDRVIIYEYSKKSYCLLNIIRAVLDKEVQKKIVIDKGYKQFIDSFLGTTTVNNNVSHC
tara:strand:- start:26 stop:463 length:438 start_codon:yes stop_codon:yes gene_type:complete